MHGTIEHLVALVDERDVLAELLHAAHVVGAQHHGGALVAQPQDLPADQFGIDGVEAAEGLIEDQQLGPVQHGGDELHLLGHALAQLLHLLVPPRAHVPALEPFLDALGGLGLVHALQAGQVHGLFAHLHLLVEATLLGQVAQLQHVLLAHGAPLEEHLPGVGTGDAGDDPDQRGLARAVGSEQPEHLAGGHGEGDVLQGGEVAVGLGDALQVQHAGRR